MDALLLSQWAKGDEPLFKARQDIVDYLHVMLEHKFFHRARKVPVAEHELKSKKKEKKEKKDVDSEKKEERKEKEKGTDGEHSVQEAGKQETAVSTEFVTWLSSKSVLGWYCGIVVFRQRRRSVKGRYG